MSKKPVIDSLEKVSVYYDRYRCTISSVKGEINYPMGSGPVREAFASMVTAYDAILFDAFGVLNRGDGPIPGAAETLARLDQEGKPWLVVSNNASNTPQRIAAKLQKMGFDVEVDRIVSSGMAVKPWAAASPLGGKPYYMIGTDDSREAYAPAPEKLMANHSGSGLEWRDAEYLLFCSNRGFYDGPGPERIAWLAENKRTPVVLANPDLVAPLAGGGVYPVAGFTAAELLDRFDLPLIGLGKPFNPIFQMALERMPGVAPERILMVGDTLDTDILGAWAMGMGTCLALSGVFADQGQSLEVYCRGRRMFPDRIVESIGA